jgi:hypothetical protein
MRTAAQRLLVLVYACLYAGAAAGQTLPSGPLAFADGRVTISGDVSGSYGATDAGFFNYTDYEHSTLRTLRINVAGAVKANEHFALLADVQTENLDTIQPYALYVRIRPWAARALDVQIGRVPPTFGAFSRRWYASDNPLIGYPLGYQYLTTLRPDALPANADELLAKRSLGWLVRYSVGDQTLQHGYPLVNGLRWDTGVQVHAATHSGAIAVTGSITSGTLSNPVLDDNNSGRQVAARFETRPVTGLVAGGSFARGAFLSDHVVNAATGAVSSDFMQTAWGADAEYSRDHFVVRGELIASAWDIPACVTCEPARRQPVITSPLRSTAFSVEGKYTIITGLYAAARIGHVGFSDITGTVVTLPWDAPVSRVEVGGGYAIQRNLLAKLAYQINRRDGGRLISHGNLPAVQLVYWF